MLNTSFNCLDRHVAAGRGAQAALIWDSPMTGQVVHFTYAELTAARGEDSPARSRRWAWRAATGW